MKKRKMLEWEKMDQSEQIPTKLMVHLEPCLPLTISVLEGFTTLFSSKQVETSQKDDDYP